ncbi:MULTISPECIES: hypothetical protein [Flavobacteriaceae]|uniref:Uncharacterized protein n=2 Tax=Flavobacteriaceae TaxID=49546 RepID=A0A4Y8ATB0_9FLAO|nr:MULTISPECIES: hypothetical protein [Flavobacteriaceae]TEW75114.1 hypothetical protein E2488_06220 [Gramella jeungdoensis]GGK41476.1 hypothetical protein GCM10007963_06860 [Lutibacter litoralis]
MGTFIAILVILGIIGGFMSRSKPTIPVEKTRFQSSNQFSTEHYNSIPNEIRKLIDEEKSLELAELLVKIEKDGHNQNLNALLKAIKFRNYELSKSMEVIRQDLRKRNYLK